MTTYFPESTRNDLDVLVVGYGPVGASLAALLGRYGVRALVIDKMADILLAPRAIALDNEALRILQMAGLTDQSFARIGIQEVNLHCPYLGRFGHINTQGTVDGHPKLVTFYQPDLERALRQQVTTFPNIQVCGELELMDLQQTSEAVTARVRDSSGGEHLIRARYLVGADGASSRVRSLIGQEFQGQTYAEDWLIVDASRRENRAIDHVEFICDPKRPTPHMPAPGGRERWEFMLQPGETREHMEQTETLATLLAPWVQPEDLTIERHAVYRFHARCCDRFHIGRVFLAGDAAHITPPFVGQGLVAGLRDAANLAWKLAWVTQGKATPAILDSYDQERRPHARQMIDLAKMMGRFVMPRSTGSALAIHGFMRLVNLIPPARTYFEELKVKPANRFKRGLFCPGRSRSRIARGGQLAQDLVRTDNQILLSDDLLGDRLTLIGIGIDPQPLLNASLRQSWEAAGGQLLHLGLRGQPRQGTTAFAEIIGNGLVAGAPKGWLAVVRPDRVVMHDGPPAQASALVTASLRMLQY